MNPPTIKYRCDICGCNFKDNAHLLRHCGSVIHLQKKTEFEKKALEEARKKREAELASQGLAPEEEEEEFEEVDYDVEISDPRNWTEEFWSEYIPICPRYINFRSAYELKRIEYSNRLDEIENILYSNNAVSMYKQSDGDSDHDDLNNDEYLDRVTKNWYSTSTLGHSATKDLLSEKEDIMEKRNKILYDLRDKIPQWKEIVKKETLTMYFNQQKKLERKKRKEARLKALAELD
jgi:hypothetical protein